MRLLTPLIKPLFASRLSAAHSWFDGSAVCDVQSAELLRMVRMARNTCWGRAHGFAGVRSYADYVAAIPTPVEYKELRPLIMRMIGGERDVLWPGVVRRYAQSSGTSDGRSKYIPITGDGFRRSHFRGTRHAVAHYLDNVPGSRLLDGRAFILGGSFANNLTLPKGVYVGDLSASLIRQMPAWADFLRVPSRRVALMEDWREKLPILAREASKAHGVTNISGVPSWMLGVANKILEISGADTLHDVWPDLEVFFHGGIAFGPYRRQYEQITDSRKMHWVENYNASEGFFAVQDDLANPAMMLLLDAGTFYEFQPIDEHGNLLQTLLPAWEVVCGQTYALVISNVNGLWRYPIGDTVRVESTSPLRISIAGRTKHFINAFGEELMVNNADDAIRATCRALDCDILNYTAGPIYASDGKRGRHHWMIEFKAAPTNLEAFAERLDEEVRRVNSDYDAKRAGNLFLDRLTVTAVSSGIFDRWLQSTGKLGGQRKVPRLTNTPKLLNDLMQLQQSVH